MRVDSSFRAHRRASCDKVQGSHQVWERFKEGDMRKLFLLLLAGTLIVLVASVSFASDAKTVNGWVSDSKCGSKEPVRARKNARKSASQPVPARWLLRIRTSESWQWTTLKLLKNTTDITLLSPGTSTATKSTWIASRCFRGNESYRCKEGRPSRAAQLFFRWESRSCGDHSQRTNCPRLAPFDFAQGRLAMAPVPA